MKILFFMRSTVYVRNFESTLKLLAAHGHEVHVVADLHLPESNDLIRRICRETPLVRHSDAPALPFNAWSYLGIELRRGVDYLRYLGPEFKDAPKLRQRADKKAPDFARAALQRPALNTAPGRRLFIYVLRWLDEALPIDPAVIDFVRAEAPDLVLVTPLVVPGSPQAEYVRAAHALGIPAGLCVYSWDNLTNKGLIHGAPDFVTVWNDAMKAEAVGLHGIPVDRVMVTGAAAYDHWFEWRPSVSREGFCARVGLPAGRPYLLYLCSSQFIAPNEVAYVRKWVTELRASSPVLRDVGVLVRPHPQNADEWKAADFDDLERLVIWPRAGANPVDVDSRADFYHSIYYSAAVVGVNTSAQIESAIVGRSVYTVLAPEFRDTQEGTLHFRHLRDVSGGVLHIAATFPEHAAQLEAAVLLREDDQRCRRFVQAFVRPNGIDVPVTPRLVAVLEDFAARKRRWPARAPWYAPIVRPFLRSLAARLVRTDKARKQKAKQQQRIKIVRDARRAALRERATAVKKGADKDRSPRSQRLDTGQAARERAGAAAYVNYLKVREWARCVRDASGTLSLTAAERQMVAGLQGLWDASPDTIAHLRRSAGPITGVRPADYEPAAPALALQLKRDVGFLRRQAGDDLFVQELPLLGGFGVTTHHERYNEDTVRYFKTLVALKDGGVLAECRRPGRRLVWEIGGGWGGFAYQFKTICPNVTYVITGIPELMLVSAVYLMAAFPDAQFRFLGEAGRDDLWRDWEQADFIFVPESALPTLHPPTVDIVVDVAALQHMDESRVAMHVQRAFDFGARYFYSQVPGLCFPPDTPPAWKAVERLFWPHVMPPRAEAAAFVVERPGTAPEIDDCAHLVAWRRLRP